MLLHNEVVNLGSSGDCFDLGHVFSHGGIVSYSSIANIILDIIIEEYTVLRHNSDRTSQVFGQYSTDIIAINFDFSS